VRQNNSAIVAPELPIAVIQRTEPKPAARVQLADPLEKSFLLSQSMKLLLQRDQLFALSQLLVVRTAQTLAMGFSKTTFE
jgi:hypothetical protein